MFHVKRIYFIILICLFTLLGYSQGEFRYSPVTLNLSLPADTAISGPLARSLVYVGLSDFEKAFVYNLNFARRNPALFLDSAVIPYLEAYPQLKKNYGQSLVEALQSAVALDQLGVDDRLFSIARAHAKDIGKHNLLSHQSSNGITSQERFQKVGIGCGSECINLAMSVNSLEVLISLLIDYNVPNLGHRRSLLNPKMINVGVGIANGTDGKTQYTVIDLACM